jgi:hypothetical protein
MGRAPGAYSQEASRHTHASILLPIHSTIVDKLRSRLV